MTASRNLLQTLTVTYCWLLLLAVSFAKYSTPKSFYRSAYYKALNPGELTSDIYLQDHISLNSSFFYDVIAFFRLPLYDDFYGLLFFLAVSALALWMTFLMVGEYFDINDPAISSVITLLLGFSFYKILITVHGGAGTPHTIAQNALAHGLGIASLYFMAGRKAVPSALCITLVLLIAPKGGFVLLPVALIYFLLRRPFKMSDALALSLPVMAIVGLSGRVAFPEEAEALIRICERVMEREDLEVAFHLQPVSALVLFVASLAATPFLANRLRNPDFRRLYWCVSLVTLGLVVFGVYYLTLGYKIYPNPKLIMLSPVRAAKFQIFLFSMIVLVLVLQNDRFSWYEKTGVLTAFFLLRGDITAIGYASFVLAITFALSKWFSRMTESMLKPFSGIPVTVFVTIIVTVAFALQLPRSYPVARMDMEMYRLTGQWTRNSNIDLADLNDFKLLASMQDDFTLLGFYEDGEHFSPVLNAVDLMARKSSFIGEPATFYHRPKLWDEAVLRRQIAENLAESLNGGERVSWNIIAQLHERRTRVMAPRKMALLFPASVTREVVGGYMLFKP
ncbi:MAG: hypothetical protein HOL66_01445 [Rhodospirillaceae bacterium]|jgi:hypothetical protein|nr:hypothetical protein [Rhodospirillaceae bacterium]MBT5242889.1 hypothetical protein [Rhodospirillaceae bacterium]MBT5563113.1 hypothetical protein [Rhodospirillaceae bacterium]MBT6243428.1 hypothetical protein [Rhodospirillaceae bacterium]MBT7138501.1 hypothetical protein [Rhodospirillaceae bacterium]